MSQNPVYPDAHPTAPGGMSQKALIAELVDKHGYTKHAASSMSWPDQINAVAHERRQRELDAKPVENYPQQMVREETDNAENFLDDLFAELDADDPTEG